MGWTFYNSSGQRLSTFGGAATQAEMEAGSSTTAYVTPGRTQFHPGVAKSWVSYDYSGGTPGIMGSYNISSLGDDGTGHIQVNYDTDLSAAHGATVAMTQTSTLGANVTGSSQAVGSVDLYSTNGSNTAVDYDGSCVIFGDQA
jgi:hypothetical protein